MPELSNFTSLAFEWKQMSQSLFDPARQWLQGRDFAVGDALRQQGVTAKHPVIIVPGVVSTGLESWSTSPEYRSYFRKRLWGTTTMIRAVLTERDKWIKALSLDPITGLDPSPDIKVRPAQGIDAASTFVPGYWIWTKAIENLAAINYDSNNLMLAAYDWRLSYYNMEVRDGFFSRLKLSIEHFKKRDGKTVLVGHSMGATVVFVGIFDCPIYLCLTDSSLKWVEAEGFGDGGPRWVEDHIEAPKAMTAFMSGEMKDTVEMNPAGTYVLEKFFSRRERASLFRGWAGSASLWMKGGDVIWGNATHAPDDLPNMNHTYGHFFSFRALSSSLHPSASNLTSTRAAEYILEHVPETWQKMLYSNYSNGIEKDEGKLKENGKDFRKWTNPLEIQLPNAPSMKMYCVYGHGKDTERSYWYARGPYHRLKGSPVDTAGAVCLNDTDCTPGLQGGLRGIDLRPPLDLPLARESWIDRVVNIDNEQAKVRMGVRIGEGDGTVSLISLGGMCVEGWKRKKWNPGGIHVKTIELSHRPEDFDLRGGATTGDHIDILGSRGLNEILLKVAAGYGNEIEDSFVSDIRRYAERIQWD
ncbi:phospholipid/diacylglycerol acyltransferase [Cantharellus anzutake]|uniref:phospholipid/diacylglycerol acyltransferase n=1 Tax=Cantharellus anzutake TaxID=1750568 RepID=UPI001907E292|nr:phospholipid/diacylglycerol acyltransferase [Cantharellus anzutake]KAF8331369.1 phospholipid/diacylglycerol acyltransferase [Cantharellus anzutake]